MNENKRFSIDNIWKSLLILTLLVYGLIATSNIFIPLVFSFFIAILLNPFVSFLERKGINKVVAIIIALLLVIIFISGGVYVISIQAKNIIKDLPQLTEKFNYLIDGIGKKMDGLFGFSTEEQIQLLKQNSDQLLSSGSSILGGSLAATSSIFTFISLSPIYIFFILLYRENFKKFLIKIGEENNSNFIKVATEVSEMIHSYIIGLLLVITIIAVLNITGLLILGINYAIFLGALSAILTIIPYIGIFIGASLPILVALITKDSLFYPLAVIAVFALVQFLEGNFITPKVVGSKVNVNPLAAIVALIIGGHIWGIVGMILAIPMTGIMKIIFGHTDRLRSYAILLQSTNKDDEQDEEFKKLRKKKHKKAAEEEVKSEETKESKVKE